MLFLEDMKFFPSCLWNFNPGGSPGIFEWHKNEQIVELVAGVGFE